MTGCAAVLFFSLCSSALICGQVHAQPKSSLYGKDSLQGVYVKDSAVAVEKFALAERLERLREWNKSAEVYQEIIEQYPDRVVPSRVDADNQIVQYSSVVSAVQERLAKWPADGLAVYRNRYETAAQAILDQAPADETQALHRAANLFFVTDTAKAAALRLIDLQIQNGEFAAAAWLGDRLLQWHPNLETERPAVLYRVAIAHRLLGNNDLATARLDELSQKYSDSIGVIRGGEVKLADSLKVELATAAALQTAAADSWPMAFGNLSRDRVPATTNAGGARLFTVPINRALPRMAGASRQQIAEFDKGEREKGFATGILPVIDNGELFFQDNARIHALSLDSGLPLPGWAETYSGERGGKYSFSGAWPTPLGSQMAVTVTDNSVLAVLGQSDPRSQLFLQGGARESRLVCLDRASGKERWSFSARALAEDRSNARSMELAGTPIVVGNRVFITAQSGSGVQFQRCEVVALDLTNGRLAWRSYIASASVNIQFFDVDSTSGDESTPQISYADGRVYVCSNLGATAALDGYDGTVIWLNLYPRNLPALNNMFNARRGQMNAVSQRRPRPWAHNPVIVSGNRVFTLPRNSEYVYVYDASNGAELSRIGVKTFDAADTLVGVINEKLLVGSAKTITCIDWTKFKPDAPIDDYRPWLKEFAGSGPTDASIQGRAFLTSDSVWVPLSRRLTRINLKSGAAISAYPADGRDWGDEEGPGNLLLTQDHMVIAGSERVAVYTDLNLAMRKLDAEVAADAQSPQPRLRYAEVMFVAGKYDLTGAKLDEAIQLLGGKDALQSGPARDRLFNSSLNFARRLMTVDSQAAATIDGFFDRAALAAGNPQQQVVYRVARAGWAKQQKNDALELDLYQQLLTDAALRAENIGNTDGGPSTTAAYFAEREIAALLARNPKVYAGVDQAAQQQFDAVSGSGDADKLLAVAQSFPNSRVAPQALFAAAAAYEGAGNAKSAIVVLRALQSRTLSNEQKLQCVESLARNYLLLPNRLEVASSRLSQASQIAPSGKLSRAISLPDGRNLENVTFAEAAAALKQLRRDQHREQTPTMSLPPVVGGADRPPDDAFVETVAPIDGVTRLVRAVPDALRYDRVVAFGGNSVRVFEPGKTEPLFSVATPEVPLGCAWLGNNLLFWTQSRVVFCKGDDSGVAAWEMGLDQIPPIEISPADEEPMAEVEQDAAVAGRDELRIRRQNQIAIQQLRGRVRINARIINNQQVRQPAPEAAANEQILNNARTLSDRVIFTTNQGRIVALDLGDGSAIWQARPSDRPLERFMANEDFVAVLFYDDMSAQIAAFDATNGQTAFRRVFSRDTVGPVNVALAADGKLIYLMPEQLVCRDLFDPSDRAAYTRTIRAADGAPVFGMEPRGAGQLMIADDRIIALTDNGQFARLYSLEDGQPITVESKELQRSIERKLRTGAGSDWNVSLQIIGQRLFAMSAFTLMSNNLEANEPAVTYFGEPQERYLARELWATNTHLLRIEEPADRAERRRQNRPGGLRISTFSRATDAKGQESARLDHIFVVSAPDVTGWQVVNGGVYYLTTDRKLHFLSGAGK